jgi:hypothetical protein
LINSNNVLFPSLAFFSKDDNILGRDYGYWITKYWNSFAFKPKQKLKEQVYFMSGLVYEGDRFTIPEQKGILLSPIKYIAACLTEKFPVLEERMLKQCEYEMDIIQDMNLFLDSELVSPECSRVRSPPFSLEKKYTAISEGYWLFIKPYGLRKGTHTISSFSSCKVGKVQLPGEYQIEIT